MGPQEKPLFLQKRWLEQAGYTEEDCLQDIGREDNSYLFKFVFAPLLLWPRLYAILHYFG